jgi:hypothetical protein
VVLMELLLLLAAVAFGLKLVTTVRLGESRMVVLKYHSNAL